MDPHARGIAGEFLVASCLSGAGCHVLFPQNQHLPYDLAFDCEGKTHRVQVKTTTSTVTERDKRQGRASPHVCLRATNKRKRSQIYPRTAFEYYAAVCYLPLKEEFPWVLLFPINTFNSAVSFSSANIEKYNLEKVIGELREQNCRSDNKAV